MDELSEHEYILNGKSLPAKYQRFGLLLVTVSRITFAATSTGNHSSSFRHAAVENKINVDKIRDSKVIQAQLELIRQEQEAEEKNWPD
jgi:hypothetical protein